MLCSCLRVVEWNARMFTSIHIPILPQRCQNFRSLRSWTLRQECPPRSGKQSNNNLRLQCVSSDSATSSVPSQWDTRQAPDAPQQFADVPTTAFGKVLQAQANFVRVRVDRIEGLSTDQQPPKKQLLCVVRTLLKKIKQTVLVGDEVELSGIDWVDGRGMVHEVIPRRNELIDPAIANVDTAFMVFSLAEPPFEAANATRFLVSAEAAGVPVRVLLNKADLLSAQQLDDIMQQVRSWGYEPQALSAQNGYGLSQLLAACVDRVSVVAGPSGVGKSSILNALSSQAFPEADGMDLTDFSCDSDADSACEPDMRTGEGTEGYDTDDDDDAAQRDEPATSQVQQQTVTASETDASNQQRSERVQWSALQRGAGGRGLSVPSTTTIGDEIEGIQAVGSIGARGRGKHTTRTVTLLSLRSGGHVADTPGFNQPTLDNVTADALAATFPEIEMLLQERGRCRFANCRHKHEPGCRVRGDWERYPFYLQLLIEVIAKDDRERERSMSKRIRQGNVRTKSVAGGGTAVEALLNNNKHRKPSRKKHNQTIRKQMDDELDEDLDNY